MSASSPSKSTTFKITLKKPEVYFLPITRYFSEIIEPGFQKHVYSNELELIDLTGLTSMFNYLQPTTATFISKITKSLKPGKVENIHLPVLPEIPETLQCHGISEDQYQIESFIEDIKELLQLSKCITLHVGSYSLNHKKQIINSLIVYLKAVKSCQYQYCVHVHAESCSSDHDPLKFASIGKFLDPDASSLQELCSKDQLIVSVHNEHKGAEAADRFQKQESITNCKMQEVYEKWTWVECKCNIDINGDGGIINVGGDGDSNDSGGDDDGNDSDSDSNGSGGDDDSGSNGNGNSDGYAYSGHSKRYIYHQKPQQNKQPHWYWSLLNCDYKGEGTTIAIIDSGIDENHTAFLDHSTDPATSRVKQRANFCGGDDNDVKDEKGHGTFCAGIACGREFNIREIEVKYDEFDGKKKFAYDKPRKINTYRTVKKGECPPGVAPKANLVICRVKISNDDEQVVKALEWVSSLNNPHVDVVSLSFGWKKYSEKLEKAITTLISSGIIVVCAASNDGYQYQQPIQYPAHLGHVLCIGSHGACGKPSHFSPIGQQIDFLAPGENIAGPALTKYESSKKVYPYRIAEGTSCSAPAVAGLVCLILECINKTCGDELKKKVHNHWVMKEVLRNMATNPGIHLNDRGYGSLDPEKFFKNPEYFVRNALGMPTREEEATKRIRELEEKLKTMQEEIESLKTSLNITN